MASVDPQDPVALVEDLANRLQQLKLMISMLRLCISFLSEWHIEDQDLEAPLKHLDGVLRKVIQELEPLTDEDWESSPANAVHLVFSSLRTLKSLADQMRQIFVPQKDVGGNSITLKNTKLLLSFIDSLLLNLEDISIYRGNKIVVSKRQIEKIKEKLVLLRFFLSFSMLNRLIEQDDVKDALCSAKTLALAFPVILCLFTNYEFDGCAKLMKIFLKKQEDEIDMVLKKIYNKFLESVATVPDDTPTIDEQDLEFTDYLIRKLRLISSNKAPCLMMYENDQIDIFIDELSFLRCNLMNMLLRNPIEEMKSLIIATRAIIINTGYVIYQSYDTVEDDDPKEEEDHPMANNHCSKLPDLLSSVDMLKQQASDLFNKFFSKSWDSNFPCGTNVNFASSQPNDPPNIINVTEGSKDEIQNRLREAAERLVGFEDAKAEIIEQLIGGSLKLQRLFIVGMPGIGKTTLAKSIYKNRSINGHFHIQAWCCVSKDYEKESLFSEILDQIVGVTMQTHLTSEQDFAQKLYQKLKGRKYLIVIDDIWSIEAWYDLKATFPDDNNGSRILFTTRCRAVAVKANSVPYPLRLFSLKESCKLLWLKLFGREVCPPELLTVSTYIARECKGLPLAVVLVAGILKGTERKEDSWEHVAQTMSRSQVTHRKYKEILELSYKHLPDCLKPCFLYFGTFPEDTTISSSKLIKLWICEGLLQQRNLCHNSLEREAENYLNDLVDRSLVMVGRRSSIGGVKECCIHDVIGRFCSRKLQDERFLKQVHMFGGISILHGDHEMCVGSLLYYYRPKRVARNDLLGGRQGFSVREVFRNRLRTERMGLSLMDKCTDEPPSSFKVLSKMMMLDSKTSQCRQFDYGSTLQFELLCVLDLEDVRVESSADASDLVNIAKLVHLSGYLEFGKLAAYSNRSFILQFPTLCSRLFRNFSQLDNLKSISALSLCHGDDVEQFILRRLTSIQKLGCKFSNSWDDSTSCNLLPVLDFLSELESLKVFFSSKALYPCKFSFPVNLKKLSISCSRLPWDEISAIGKLPSLEVLKLLNKAFEGRLWDMREDEFQKLKYLKLDSLDIELWNAYSEHLPCLKQLVVLNCQQLEAIPSSFGEIVTLELLEMKWCSSSATESVKQILEDQRNMSNNQLNVNVVGP